MCRQILRRAGGSKSAWKPTAAFRRGFLWQRKTVLAEQGPQVRAANEHPAEAQIPVPVSEEAGSAQSSSYHKARGMLPFPRPLSEQ